MSKILKFLLPVFVFFNFAATAAQAESQQISVFGSAMVPCSQWLVDSASTTMAGVYQDGLDDGFVDGYLIGLERMYSIDHHVSVINTRLPLFDELHSFCVSHPQATMIDAADQIWLHTGGFHVAPRPPSPEPTTHAEGLWAGEASGTINSAMH